MRAIERIIKVEQFKLAHVKDNTALVPHSKEWIATQEGVITVLQNAREQRLSDAFKRLGFPIGEQLSVDLSTGKVWIGE